jgi:GTP-binding protein
MTRDRISEVAEWRGRAFEIIDTGGIIPSEAEVIPRRIYEQAKTAIEKARAILFVVDCRTGVNSVDAELAKILFETSKPVFVVVNKCDSPKLWTQALEFHELGFDKIFPISAEHGLNVGDLLDEVIKTFPENESAEPVAQDETRVAILGKPNVGKSTLLNKLLGEERVIVSPTPGTTRDPIDSLFNRDGSLYRFIDTAGIRKKSQTVLMAEKLSVIMAKKSLERCDVALVVLDAKEAVSALDATIAGYAHDAGVSVILVVNKWDLITKSESTQREYEEKIRSRLKFLGYAPLLFISAETGQGVAKLLPLIDKVALARQSRVGTAELNSFLQKVALHKASVPFNRRVKVQYMTQVSVAPPTFALFTNRQGKLHFSLERYLINRIRERFGFLGTPIILKQKMERKAG